MERSVLNVQDFDGPESSTAGIQEAVNALPASGGVVHLPPGRYALRRSVELRSGVTVRGEGPATVLLRPKEVIIPVTRPSDGSQTTLQLKSVLGLRVGDEIHITDDDSWGWWASHCVITAIKGRTLTLDVRHGEKRYRYLPSRNAFAANWFPAFWLREVRGAAIERLTIDGVRKPLRPICDFVVAAVHSHRSEELRVKDVTVRNWPGDGIGIQNGSGAVVTGCLVERCSGHGYHPGTGITQSVWADNIARNNTRDGLFFCMRVTHSTVRGNVLVGNGGHGIGGLSDPDHHNVVTGNVCAENDCHGIDAEKSIGNVIQGNLCRNNSQGKPGAYAGIFLSEHRDCVVTGNACIDDQAQPTQLRGLVDLRPTGRNLVHENHCSPW